MSRYAFVDIGISHMNFCIIDFTSKEQHEIVKWEMVDLTQGTIAEKKVCCVCQKKATKKHTENNHFYCSKKGCTKTLDHTKLQPMKTVKCVRVGLEGLGLNIVREFDKHPEFDTCHTIFLENQPVYKQPTMKSVQIMLYMYLLMRMEHSNSIEKPKITMSHAKSKLDIYDGPEIDPGNKKDYALRKYLSVEYTKYFLKKYGKDAWYDFLMRQPKKDDFADSYISVLTKCCVLASKNKMKQAKPPKEPKIPKAPKNPKTKPKTITITINDEKTIESIIKADQSVSIDTCES